MLKVPQSAFDPSRPPSSLLVSHIRELQTAVLDAVDTEGEAAECIRSLTALLQTLRPHVLPQAHRDAVRAASPRRRSRARRSPRQTRSARRPRGGAKKR